MAKSRLIPVIVAVVLAGAALVVGGGQVSRLNAQLRLSREQLAALTMQRQALTEQLAALQEERRGFEERLAGVRNQLAQATTELERARQSLKELETREGQLRTERDQLKAQVGSLQAAREEAGVKARRLAEDNAELTRTVGRLRERLALLDRDVQQLQAQLTALQAAPQVYTGYVSAPGPSVSSSAATPTPSIASRPGTVELPPIIVRKEQAGMSLPVQGRVVEVNTQHAFIVVDKGSADGVRPGMRFDVVRAGKTLGQATVVRVRPTLAACDLNDLAHGPIQTGDLAIQRSP